MGVEQPLALFHLRGERRGQRGQARRVSAERDLDDDPVLAERRRGVVAVTSQRVGERAELVGHLSLQTLPACVFVGVSRQRLLDLARQAQRMGDVPLRVGVEHLGLGQRHGDQPSGGEPAETVDGRRALRRSRRPAVGEAPGSRASAAPSARWAFPSRSSVARCAMSLAVSAPATSPSWRSSSAIAAPAVACRVSRRSTAAPSWCSASVSRAAVSPCSDSAACTSSVARLRASSARSRREIAGHSAASVSRRRPSAASTSASSSPLGGRPRSAASACSVAIGLLLGGLCLLLASRGRRRGAARARRARPGQRPARCPRRGPPRPTAAPSARVRAPRGGG